MTTFLAHITPLDIGVVVSALAVGAVLGALAMARVRNVWDRESVRVRDDAAPPRG